MEKTAWQWKHGNVAIQETVKGCYNTEWEVTITQQYIKEVQNYRKYGCYYTKTYCSYIMSNALESAGKLHAAWMCLWRRHFVGSLQAAASLSNQFYWWTHEFDSKDIKLYATQWLQWLCVGRPPNISYVIAAGQFSVKHPLYFYTKYPLMYRCLIIIHPNAITNHCIFKSGKKITRAMTKSRNFFSGPNVHTLWSGGCHNSTHVVTTHLQASLWHM